MPELCDVSRLGLDARSEVARLLAQHPDIEARIYREGEYLIREQEASREIFILLGGALAVEQAPAGGSGQPSLLACILCEEGRPVVVGEMAYLGDFPRTASIRSAGRSHVLCLKPAHIDAVIQGFPELTRAICQQFALRLRETNASLKELKSRFALGVRTRMAAPGEVLFQAGDPAETLFQLMSGSVRLERGGGAVQVSLERLPQGFLEMEVYLGKRRHVATATVVEHAFLVAVDQSSREGVVRSYPELVLACLEA